MGIGNRPLTRVDIEIDNNLWWTDAFQFGDPLDQTWNFNGCSFYLNVQKRDTDPVPLLALTSGAATIVVQDPNLRVLALLVPDLIIRNTLPTGHYVYDLIMVLNATGQTDGLMYGQLEVKQGVTVGPS